jgi:CheY-like chemotaxis protein
MGMVRTEERRARLLVVDDEVLNRELMRRVLGRAYEIEQAEGAFEARAILERRAHDIGLILCDQQMPILLGTDFAYEVCQRWPVIPLVLVTAYEDAPAVLAAQRDGSVRAVIAKPWRGSTLLALIAELLVPARSTPTPQDTPARRS